MVITGIGVGFMSAFFGVGGGSLLLPVMYSAFAYMTPTLAIPISLGTISLNTLMNVYRYYKSGIFPSKQTIFIFLITCSIGVLVGGAIINAINPEVAKKILGFILLIIVGRLVFSKTHIDDGNQALNEPPLPMALTGLIGSFLAGVTGLGGGIIFVPIFIMVLKMPIKYVTPVSNVAMCIGAIIGVIPYFFLEPNLEAVPGFLHSFHVGAVNILYIAILFICGFFAGKLGVKWNNSISPKFKKNLLALIVLLLALKLLV